MLGKASLIWVVLAVTGCSSGASPTATATVDAAAPPPVTPAATDAPSSAASALASAPIPMRLPGVGGTPCGLPAPVKSEDACASNADCGPSDPCHAHACVAKAKAKPRGPHMMCTEIMDCRSTDANDCSCLEGHCALVPRP